MTELIQNGRVKYEYGHRVTYFKFIVDVTPDEGAPFRTETSGWFEAMHSPRKGDVVKVVCNPADKSVELQVSDDVRYNVGLADKANTARLAEQRQRLLGGEPGTD